VTTNSVSFCESTSRKPIVNGEQEAVEDAPFILMRWRDRPDASPEDIVVVGIYSNMEAVEERLKRVAKANAQYPMRRLTPTLWEIGPEEDEGFFGNKPMRFMVRQPKVRSPQ
jgi:hypothetical protein